MPRLVQVDSDSSVQAPCPKLSRREAVVRVGSWMVYLGALSGMAACAPPTITDEGNGVGPTPTPNPTGTPTPSPTGTPDTACGCNSTPGAGWTSLGIASASIPLNAVAYNGGNQLFICHDAAGLYVMSSLCTHAFENIGAGGCNPTDLSAGFTCPHHGATFDANGNPLNGIGSTTLQHYGLTSDATGNLYVNLGMSVASSCRC